MSHETEAATVANGAGDDSNKNMLLVQELQTLINGGAVNQEAQLQSLDQQ